MEQGKRFNDVLIGRNAVLEALRAGRTIDKIFIARTGEGPVAEIIKLAKEKGIPVSEISRQALMAKCARGDKPQGVVAFAAQKDYCTVWDILDIAAKKEEKPFIIIADEIEDPHNLGAIIRTADAVGAHGIIIPKRRSVGLNYTVAKTSAGALEFMNVAKTGSLSQTTRDLKERGIFVAGADHRAEKSCFDADFDMPLALIIGSEGRGISRLLLSLCDFTVSIPMRGNVSCLNASNAAAILMYEVLRKRMKN